LGEPLRVIISSNAAHVVRSQAYLQREVAAAIEQKLGWQVSPSGSARLNLTIDEEKITAIGNNNRGIATRWRIELEGNAMLTSKHGNVIRRWSATGYSAGLNDEAAALEQAAENAGQHISTWLEGWSDRRVHQQDDKLSEQPEPVQ
jgi:hypothetical protein